MFQWYNIIYLYNVHACTLLYVELVNSRNMWSANISGIQIFRFLHFGSLFIYIKYTYNMAAWFYAQFYDLRYITPHNIDIYMCVNVH